MLYFDQFVKVFTCKSFWLYRSFSCRGHQQLSKEEVHEIYRGSHVPLRVTEDSMASGRDCKMVQFLDLFSLPEATLFANVMEVGSSKLSVSLSVCLSVCLSALSLCSKKVHHYITFLAVYPPERGADYHAKVYF